MHKLQIANWLRLVARVGSLAAAALVAAFIVGNWPPPLTAGFLLFPLGVLVGTAIAWRWEVTGGLVAMACLAGFYLKELAIAGSLPTGPWFLLIAAPALLFLVAGCLSSWHEKPENSRRAAA